MGNLRILVVDDDHDNLEVLVELLGEHPSISAYGARDGFDALHWIKRHGDPDTVLLDVVMPVYDGAWFMKNYHGPARIVVFSASPGSREKLPWPPFAFLTKPKSLDDVERLVLLAANCNGRAHCMEPPG